MPTSLDCCPQISTRRMRSSPSTGRQHGCRTRQSKAGNAPAGARPPGARTPRHWPTSHRRSHSCAKLETNESTVERELELQLRLHLSLQALKGYAAPETEAAIERARQLAETLGEARTRVKALYGMWSATVSAGELVSSRALATEIAAAAALDGSARSTYLAHIAQAGSCVNLAELSAAVDHANGVLDASDEDLADLPLVQRAQALLYGTLAATLLGAEREARRGYDELLLIASREDGDPMSLFIATLAASVIGVWMRELAQTTETSARLVQIGEEYGLPAFTGWGDLYGGWAASLAGRPDGLETLKRGLAQHVAIRQRLGLNHSLGLLAEVQVLHGQLDRGRLDRRKRIVVTRSRGANAPHAGAAPYERSHPRIVRRQCQRCRVGVPHRAPSARDIGATLLELRCTTDYARWLSGRSRSDEAVPLLSAVWAFFEPGSKLWDVHRGREVLVQLGDSSRLVDS